MAPRNINAITVYKHDTSSDAGAACQAGFQVTHETKKLIFNFSGRATVT